MTQQSEARADELPAKPRKPPCPDCGTKLQIVALTDDWGTIFYCEKCGYDERAALAKTGGT